MGWRNRRLAHNFLSFTVTRAEGRSEVSQFSPNISTHFNGEKPLRHSLFPYGNIKGICFQLFKYIRAFFRIKKQRVTIILSTKLNTSSDAKQMVMVRVPFNTAKSKQDGRILGGTTNKN
jgi:hypothetical protein